jgi:translocation and assembly module TamB
VLNWSPASLFGLRARIDLVSVRHLVVLRLPVASAPAKPAAPGGGFTLPVAVDVRALTVARADVAAPVAGTAFAVAISAHAYVPSLQAGQGALAISRLDGAGEYRVDGTVTAAGIAAHLSVREPQHGLIEALAKLPALGGIDVTASLDGPRNAEQALVTAQAGALRANIAARVDLIKQQIAAEVNASAPSMQPGPGVSWQSVELHGHVTGAFTRPDATAQLAIVGLQAAGASIAKIAAHVSGNQGAVRLHASVEGTRIPGRAPDLLAAAPVEIDGDIDLAAAGRPAHVTIAHPLLAMQARAQTAGDVSAHVEASLPDLAPLAAASGAVVRGSARLVADVATEGNARRITLSGTTDITGGQAPVPGLVGAGTFEAEAMVRGQAIDLRSARVDGRALHVDAAGTITPDALDLKYHLGLSDLAALSPQAVGAVKLAGAVTGAPSRLAVTAEMTGDAGTAQFPKGPVKVSLSATDIPAAPQAILHASVRLRDADAVVDANATTETDGTLKLVVTRADWKSLAIRADIARPRGGEPAGTVSVLVGSLGDFAAFVHQDLAGRLKLALNTRPAVTTVEVQGSDLAAAQGGIGKLSLSGRATGDIADPDLNATLSLAGIHTAKFADGMALITAAGKQAAIAVTAKADVPALQGDPANFSTTALLDMKARQVTLRMLAADWKTLSVRLLGPARIDAGAQVAVDRLALAFGQARLQVAGRISPTLDVTASLKNFTPDILQPFAPGLGASGVVEMDAHITGTPGAPGGTVHLAATGLRMKTGPAASIPAARIAANVTLRGSTAALSGHIDAGPKLRLAASGTAPLQAGGALALATKGSLDLSLLDPILLAQGRRMTGQAGIDLAISGTAQAPRITGQVTLANGEIRDFAQGLDLRNIAATIDASGDSFTIRHFAAAAGPGTIAVSGSIGAFAPGMPIDLRIAAKNARPLTSDLLTASFDADLTVHGQAAGNMDAAGKIVLHRMEINIPDALPPSVVRLDVRRPGQVPAAPAPAAPPSAVRLAITVDAPSNIFVRGKGLYAEMAGTMHVNGTAAAPQITGGFDMRRGDFSLAGTTLTFTRGTVGFNGASATGAIDPTLDFQADSEQSGITATLKVGGYADAPKITLSSVPDLPQDEVLAHLLFGTSMSQLTPFQIAEIGAALAELSGLVGGEGPLGAIRKGLGLDRLSVGGGSGGAGASVEGGRYVAKGVYVGAKQSAGGAGGTQVQVQVDITRHIKLNTALGTGGASTQGATPQNDPGSSVGLSYQFEY